MRRMISHHYIRFLVGLFFVGAFVDFLLPHDPNTNWPRLLIWLALAPPLWGILSVRLRELGYSTRWALVAVLPMLGILVGIVLYFLPPAQERSR